MSDLDPCEERDDRLEALAEWRAEQGIPEPCDDEYWEGVL